jgi:hypothetical protein
LFIAAGCATAAVQPAPTNAPVVAIMLTNGRLLPLATLSNGEWTLFPWPQHDREDNPSPRMPAHLDTIPQDWFSPLAVLPTTWRMQPVNGQSQFVRTGRPTMWSIAAFDTIGLETDYVDADPDHRESDFNAGIAVDGDLETLPVRQFQESASEWAALVRRHAPAFFDAERADARRQHERFKGRSVAATAKELRSAEVSLYRVDLGHGDAYAYFEAIVRRPGDAESKRFGCPTQSVEYHGLLERRRGREVMKWIAGAALDCGTLTEVMQVLGGVRVGGRVFLVVEYSGDDWQDFAVVDPAGPESKIRRGPRGRAN